MERQAEWVRMGQTIRMLRKECGLTQEMLAENAELSTSYLSYLESGRKKASLGALIRIAAALQVTVDRLLGETQASNLEVWVPEVCELLQDCSALERRAILEASQAVKRALREKECG